MRRSRFSAHDLAVGPRGRRHPRNIGYFFPPYVTNERSKAQHDMKNAALKSLLVASAGIACGMASGTELMIGSSRICAVAAQNRSKAPMSTDGVDDLVERAMTRAGF